MIRVPIEGVLDIDLFKFGESFVKQDLAVEHLVDHFFHSVSEKHIEFSAAKVSKPFVNFDGQPNK